MKKWLITTLCLSIIFASYGLSACGDTIVRPIQSVSPSEAPVAGAVSYPVELTDIEIMDFQTTLNNASNYGFLLSDHADVRYVNLDQLFYIGAGLPAPASADDIRLAYLAAIADDAPDCDCTIITAQQAGDFLLTKTGYSLAEMSSGLSWYYVSTYDAYIHWHGDTSFISVSCTGGRRISDDTYEIEYEIPGGVYEENCNYYSGGMVTVKASGVTIQFISNTLH